MAALKKLTLDLWSPLDYKTRFVNALVGAAPTWVGDHARRLQAYTMLKAYVDNQARLYLDTDDDDVRNRRREFGDAALIVETIVDAVLGEDATIGVEGAENEEEPDAVADAILEWFIQWDKDERLLLSIIEAETDAVSLGDGVYVIAYDAAAGRPTVTVYDPGFYFPVITEATRQYPDKVHIAWEFERETPDGTNEFIRRITWQLVDLGEEGARALPWNAEPSQITCLMSDGVWPLRSMEGKKVEDLTDLHAEWMTNADGEELHNLDLDIDFIPVVHLPNTIARKEHFGRSSLMLIMQLLDELHGADTDLSLTARTTGFPPLGVDGSLPVGPDGKTITSYRPGTVFGGKVSIVDTSSALDALIKYVMHLLGRLDNNSRLSGTSLGVVEPSKFKSGFHMALSFGALKSLVRKMRLARSEKYPLIGKFVARFAMQAELIPANTKLPTITLDFGSFLPSDVDAEIERIRNLFKDKLISRLTAITMLIDLGLAIEDAEEELEAIQHEDFEGADLLQQIAGDDAVGDYLGIEIEEKPVEPPLVPGLPRPAPAPAPQPPRQ